MPPVVKTRRQKEFNIVIQCLQSSLTCFSWAGPPSCAWLPRCHLLTPVRVKSPWPHLGWWHWWLLCGSGRPARHRRQLAWRANILRFQSCLNALEHHLTSRTQTDLEPPLGYWAPGSAGRRWSARTAVWWCQAVLPLHWPWWEFAGPARHLCRYWPAGWRRLAWWQLGTKGFISTNGQSTPETGRKQYSLYWPLLVW